MQAFERYLERWHNAGLLDETTESAIRQYEKSQATPSGRRWQVVIALVLGGILLGAGVLLFVAAHWDDVSPLARLSLVMAMLAIFRGGHRSGRADLQHAGALAGSGDAVGHLRAGRMVAAGR
jgi:uncharacterized membrane protein